jgi:hypothetical protein
MPAYDNTDSGALFKNDRKTDPKQPDYTGSLNVDGTDYWLSGWIKTAGPMARNAGSKFLSVAVTPKEVTANGGGNRAPVDYDDDIPF